MNDSRNDGLINGAATSPTKHSQFRRISTKIRFSTAMYRRLLRANPLAVFLILCTIFFVVYLVVRSGNMSRRSYLASGKFRHSPLDEASGKFANADEYGDFESSSEVLDGTCRPRNVSDHAHGDIQMLDAYESMAFTNKLQSKGWVQGWDITYDKEAILKEKPLEVIAIPHSHNDPGWLYTFEGYYDVYTRNILSSASEYLPKTPDMRFIWAEISFLELWWSRVNERERDGIRKSVANGQIEVVTGAWVMTDEANSHYYATIMQMIEGHEWVQKHLGVKPVSHWSIDPFGLSPTMAYLLKQSNITHAVIQRVHYAVKRHLAKRKQLEFRWRQLWAGDSQKTDVLTHMMPFKDYDIPRTCGPEPEVCCQFDFVRYVCYFGSPAARIEAINEQNVGERAALLADQYRKKAQLYAENTILVPIGEDFRYQQLSEWQAQHDNYAKMFKHINEHKDKFNMNLRFGTLKDYFNVLEKRLAEENKQAPILSGDFFTYADMDDHYWSGYFTSRPFYKEMSRSLQHYLRTADLLFSFAVQTSTATKKDFPSLNLYDNLVSARRELSVFQHHDGVTGTAKDEVMKDYGQRMLRSLSDTQQVIDQSSHFLLNVSGNDLRALRSDEDFFIDKVPEKAIIKPGSTVVLFNSLARQREEVVCVHVTATQVSIQSVNDDGQKEEIDQQIAPVLVLKDNKIASEKDKYELCFMASIPAMGFRKYSLAETPELDRDVLVDIFTEGDVEIEHSKLAKIDKDPEVSNSFLTANFDGKTGFLKSIKTSGARDPQQVKLSFVKYGARPQGTLKGPLTSSDSMSGAYLFLPDGPAKPFTSSKNAYVVVKGPVRSSVVVKGPLKAQLLHRVHLDANGRSLRIQNEFDIRGLADTEVAMRFDTLDAKEQEKGGKEDKKASKEGEMSDFFSDLNGYQIIRRRRFEKLPIQAHFFPMPSAAYIESPTRRLSLYSQQPGGVASLTPGQLEVMLDRRLDHDDNRGLDQPVHDNRPTKADFRLFLEDLEAPSKPVDKHAPTTGFHTLAGNREQLKLQYPVVTLHTEGLSAKDTEASPNELSLLSQPLPCDVHLLALRTTTAATTYDSNPTSGKSSRQSTPEKASAMILHRFGVDCRATQSVEGCSMAGSKVQLGSLFRQKPKSIAPSSLSLLYVEESSVDSLPIEPMEIKTVKVNF